MASPIADYVVSIGGDGQIVSRGSVSDAIAQDAELLGEVDREAEIMQKDDEVIDAVEPDGEDKRAAGKLVLAEEMALGRVTWDARASVLPYFDSCCIDT